MHDSLFQLKVFGLSALGCGHSKHTVQPNISKFLFAMVRAAQARSLMAPGDTMQAYQKSLSLRAFRSFAQDELVVINSLCLSIKKKSIPQSLCFGLLAEGN